jgi:hypothetical protein
MLAATMANRSAAMLAEMRVVPWDLLAPNLVGMRDGCSAGNWAALTAAQ